MFENCVPARLKVFDGDVQVMVRATVFKKPIARHFNKIAVKIIKELT